MSQIALQLIAEAKEKQSTYLDLGCCGLTPENPLLEEVWDGLGTLLHLEVLILSTQWWEWDTNKRKYIKHNSQNQGKQNYLRAIPACLEKLILLKKLIIRGNAFDDRWELDTLKHLHFFQNLIYLDISSNNINKLEGLDQLKQLQHLYISYNKINKLEGLDQLKQLQHLVIYNNNINKLEGLDQLPLQKRLDISYNPIKDLSPVRHLIENDLKVKWDYLEDGLCIKDCPLTHPPIEIAKQGNAAILRYFKEMDKAGSTNVYEAKLLLTGSGEVGKTSLRLRLNDKACPLPQADERTEQVDISTYAFPINKDQNIFKMHIWDFGGQQIIHHFHRLFMHQSALYLLMTETSRDNDDFDYWLHTIELYGKNSPILFVQNERNGIPKGLDIRPYKSHFNIKDDLHIINLLNNKGLDDLEKAIQYYVQQLPHIKRTIPKSWLAIREALEKHTRDESHCINYSTFRKICREEGDITSPEGIKDLGLFLHHIGAILWYHQNPVLKQKLILERHWATEGLFKIMFDPTISETGYFSRTEAEAIWAKYPDYCHHTTDLLAMMQEFKLCFPKRSQKNNYIIPALLPAIEPTDIDWDCSKRMTVEYHYQTILPRGLVNYLTAVLSNFIIADSHVWHSGTWLHSQEGAQAKITENRFRRKIRIELGGEQYRELFGAIKKEMDDIHQDYGGVEVDLMIPCVCEQCEKASLEGKEFYKYQQILKRHHHSNKRTIECRNSYEDVVLQALLDNILTGKKASPPKQVGGFDEGLRDVFISYAPKDISYREELEKWLKPVLRHKNIEGTWHDGKIIAGQMRTQEIEKHLTSADLIILLISTDFATDDFIDAKQMPIIQDRFNDPEDDCIVVPIIVRPNSYWENSDWSDIQALPILDGELISISEWANEDKAWKAVIEEIKRLL